MTIKGSALQSSPSGSPYLRDRKGEVANAHEKVESPAQLQHSSAGRFLSLFCSGPLPALLPG